ncbi:hypothetical protein [Mycobacterium nebraskense]|uniref:hypothetical protein n=1 Tax=Mycobacterium nebraskense TaxID=244292 RepID=UPI000AC4F8DB|nr:hypothetical protein [Mycobacterium nebraskense]
MYGYLTEGGDLDKTQLLVGDDLFMPYEARRLAADLLKAADEIERVDPKWIEP